MAAPASQPWFDDRGPSTAFAEAAGRLGLAITPEEIRERFETHPAPHSLKALVEVAASCGVEVRAFRADPDSLATVPLPAIVHLQLPDRDEMAFGLLVGRGDDGEVVISEGTGQPPQRLSRDQFLRRWTGILATLTVRGQVVRPSAPRAGLLWRIRRRFETAGEGPRTMFLARWLAAAALLAGAAAGAWKGGHAAAGAPGGALAVAALALLLVGIAAGFALLQASRVTSVPSATPRLSSRICHRGGLTDCEGVLSSRWSSVFGIDLSSLGAAFLVSAAVLVAIAGFVPGAGAAPLAWLGVAFVIAVPESLLLIGVQVWPLRRICPLCMTVHAVVLVCAALGLALWLASPLPALDLARAAVPWALLHGVLFLLAYGLLVPFVDLGIEARTNRTRLAWIGATPLGALAELIGRPRDVTREIPSLIEIGSPQAPLRVDALVHPMCTGCGPVVRQLLDFQRAHADKVRLAFHVPPRDLSSRGDRELCAALAALGAHAGGAAAIGKFVELEPNPWPALAVADRDVRDLLADWTGLPRDDARLGELLARGREATRVADELAVRLQRGTPTVLVGGRPWEAPVADLEALLARQPGLLGAAIGVRLGAGDG
ncbi:MAG: hypothetical protein D6738_09535 [Acidobacteria bacterium]|nr:MAG: hypothetical protein D6738_09535 [Acidobacteriota bacterium]